MIELRRVSKRFDRVRALDSISLTIAPGERVAIVGTNGSGKSTLLRAILGLIRVEGTVLIQGVDVARDPERALASVAYAPQIAPPVDAPVDELVRAYSALRGMPASRVHERAEQLGLSLGEVSRARFRDLSGGTKQKVLAALALAVDAPVLACDEPTANLDAHARFAFFELVRERAPDSVLVLCSHRIDEVRHLVGRVIELRDGRVARDMDVAELFSALHTVRIEVLVRTGAPPSFLEFLTREGFTPIAPSRFGAALTQTHKVDVVARLLARHRDDVVDLTIEEDAGLPTAAPESQRSPIRSVA